MFYDYVDIIQEIKHALRAFIAWWKSRRTFGRIRDHISCFRLFKNSLRLCQKSTKPQTMRSISHSKGSFRIIKLHFCVHLTHQTKAIDFFCGLLLSVFSSFFSIEFMKFPFVNKTLTTVLNIEAVIYNGFLYDIYSRTSNLKLWKRFVEQMF